MMPAPNLGELMAPELARPVRALEHDPEKWVPVSEKIMLQQ